MTTTAGRWFRVYERVLDDPKLQRLEPALFKGWLNLMCVASAHDGNLPPDDVAFRLRMSEQDAKKLVRDLVAKKLIDQTGDGFRMHDWGDWQYRSDISTERVRKHRQSAPRNGDETFQETPSDRSTKHRGGVSQAVSGTPPDSDSESESESDDDDDSSSSSAREEIVIVVRLLGEDFKTFKPLKAKRWLKQYTDLRQFFTKEELRGAAEIARAQETKVESLNYLSRIAEEVRRKGKRAPPAQDAPRDWNGMVRAHFLGLKNQAGEVVLAAGWWADTLGPKPGEPYCRAPPDIVAKYPPRDGQK